MTGQAANTVLVKYALVGDTNLDGNVGLDDYNAVVRNFGKTGASWDQGDFFYEGTIGLDDYNAVVRNFGRTLPAALTAISEQSTSSVPEPATLPLLLALLAVLLYRPNRRSIQRGV